MWQAHIFKHTARQQRMLEGFLEVVGKAVDFSPNKIGIHHPAAGENFSAVFGRKLLDLANTDKRVCALTAAMSSGTGLEEFALQCALQLREAGGGPDRDARNAVQVGHIKNALVGLPVLAQFIPHGSVAELKRSLGLDAASLCKRSLESLIMEP